MQLNPRQLDAFRKVMVTGSMTIAAEMMKISQPAVSRLIKDLEQTLNFRLFRREGNRLIAGPEAQRLFIEVDRYYQGIERVEQVAAGLRSLRTGTLRVASMTTLGLSVVAEGVCRFSRNRPEVTTSLEVRHSLSILELVAANQFDIGFAQVIHTEYPGVEIIPFASVDSVVMLPDTHRLARKKVVKITDLQGEALVSLSPNNPHRVQLDLALDVAGVSVERTIETTLAASACRMVAGGLGLAVIDPFSATYIKYPGTVYRPLQPSIPVQIWVVLPAHQQRSRVVTDFMQVMRDLFREEVTPQIEGKIGAHKKMRFAPN